MIEWANIVYGLIGGGIVLTLIGLLSLTSRASTTSGRKMARSTGSTETVTGISELESRMRALELEWTDTYSKLSRLAGRLAKQNALDKAPAATEDGARVSRHELLAKARRAD